MHANRLRLGHVIIAALMAALTTGCLSEEPLNPKPSIGFAQASQVPDRDSVMVLLSGRGFLSSSVVRLDGGVVPSRFLDSSRVELRLPLDSSGNRLGVLTIENGPPGGGVSAPQPLVFRREFPNPTVASLVPAFAEAGADSAVVRLSGSGFVSQTSVQADGRDLVVRYINGTALDVVLPRELLLAQRALALQIRNPAPGGGPAFGVPAFVVRAPVPVLIALQTPTIAAGQQRATLAIDGRGFVDSSVVRVNGVPRPSQRISATRMEVRLPEDDLSREGTLEVTVASPAPGGGVSNALTLTLQAGTPTATLPISGATVGRGFSLIVNGTGFVQGAVVLVNGGERTTTFVNTISLTAVLTDADVASAGVLQIAVRNPGNRLSASVPLTLRVLGATDVREDSVLLRTADVLWHAPTQTLLASVRSDDAQLPNRVVRLDPVTGAVVAQALVGPDPGLLALSDDGSTVWVGLNGASQVRRLSAGSLAASTVIQLPQGQVASAIVVLDPAGSTVVVSRSTAAEPTSQLGASVYDDGTPRPASLDGSWPTLRLQRTPNANELIGFGVRNGRGALGRFAILPTGLVPVDSVVAFPRDPLQQMIVDGQTIFIGNGDVLDARTFTASQPLTLGGYGITASSAQGRAVLLTVAQLQIYDLQSRSRIATLRVADALATIDPLQLRAPRLTSCGSGCIAWTAGRKIHLVRSPVLVPAP